MESKDGNIGAVQCSEGNTKREMILVVVMDGFAWNDDAYFWIWRLFASRERNCVWRDIGMTKLEKNCWIGLWWRKNQDDVHETRPITSSKQKIRKTHTIHTKTYFSSAVASQYPFFSFTSFPMEAHLSWCTRFLLEIYLVLLQIIPKDFSSAFGTVSRYGTSFWFNRQTLVFSFSATHWFV